MTNEQKLAEIERLLRQSCNDLDEVTKVITDMENMVMLSDPSRPKQTETPRLLH